MALKLRRANGPNFTWPLIMFSGDLGKALAAMGKIYHGKPLRLKSRKELIASMKPHYWQYLRPDNGDFPTAISPPPAPRISPPWPWWPSSFGHACTVSRSAVGVR